MDSLIAQLILQDHRVGYLVVNRDLKLVEINDTLSLYSDDPQRLQQASLWDLVPELVGNEDVVADLMGRVRYPAFSWM